MNATLASQRHDDTATARQTECPDCNGSGDVSIRFGGSGLDPGAVRTFHQPCRLCGGVGKVWTDGGSEQK